MAFQLQIQDANLSGLEYIRSFDPNAPTPQSLGDRLYGCILNKNFFELLEEDCLQSLLVRLHTLPIGFHIENELYSTKSKVFWRENEEPTLIQIQGE